MKRRPRYGVYRRSLSAEYPGGSYDGVGSVEIVVRLECGHLVQRVVKVCDFGLIAVPPRGLWCRKCAAGIPP